MRAKSTTKRRWGAEQRLAFIESRLYWDGVFSRSDLIERFGVSAAQASADLAAYKELASANLYYDGSEKRFIANESFSPVLFQPNADRYLLQLRAIGDQVISPMDAAVGVLPLSDAMPIPHRRIDPQVLRRLLAVVRRNRGLSVCYHSMNEKYPLPLWRVITPHAFAFDGLRWHVRAYCEFEQRFKDFILSRILELGPDHEPGKSFDEDQDWNAFFDVILVPNPKLSETQQQTVANDYEMTGGELHMQVRCALLYYFNKRLRLDIAEQVDNPRETPIVVANKAEFRKALAKAGA